MLNAFCDAVFCSIDTAFGNYISTDVIAALGSFWTIHWVLKQSTSVGILAYQVWRRHPYNCITLSMIVGFALGILLAIFREPVSHIFELTAVQYEMLQQCLLLDGITLPMEAAGRFMMGYITYNCNNKLMIGSNLTTYIFLIVTDYLAVALNLGCLGLVATTALTWGIYLLITVIGCKFWRVRDKIHISHLLYCVQKSRNLLVYKIVSRVAYAVYGHFASTLGTDYIIHTMCTDIINVAEEFRQGMYNYQLVVLKPAVNKLKVCAETNKRFYLPSMLIEITFCLVTVIFVHGKVPLADVLPFLLLYMIYYLILPLYDSLNAYLVVTGRTGLIAVKSVIACICKIGITALFLHLGFGLYGMAAIIFLETLIAIIYYLKNCNWLRYKERK